MKRTLLLLTIISVLSCSNENTPANSVNTTNKSHKLDSAQMADLSEKILQLEKDSAFNPAILILDSALQLHDNCELFYLRGQIKAQKFDSQGAIHDFDMAIYINPNYADAYYARANQKALTESDIKTPKACEDFIKAKQLGCEWVTDETVKFCLTN